MSATTRTIHTLKEFTACAETFAATLRAGDRIGLIGGLGAGKTTFVQIVARYLGLTAPVESPTFILRQAFPLPHPTIHQLIHFDLYRLGSVDNGPEQFDELGIWEDWAEKDALILVEWADLWPALSAKLTHQIEIGWSPETERRTIRIQEQ